MENNYIDKLFRESVDKINGLSENVKWNNDTGWKQYQEQFYPKRTKVRRFAISMVSIAAIVVVVIFAMKKYQSTEIKNVVMQNKTSEVRQMNLPDGNKIWLNVNSSIEYPVKMNSKNFEINVIGEVYIEIDKKKSERYILKANNAVVVIEKTSSVNIKAYPDKENIEIDVKTGAVKVFEDGSPKGLALLVTEGNYCSVHKSQKLIYASTIINDNYLAWKTGRLIFDDQPIATVIDILSEYYDTTIEISDKSLAFCLFSGSFEKPTLSNILTKIQRDLNLEIKYTGTKITISGIGC